MTTTASVTSSTDHAVTAPPGRLHLVAGALATSAVTIAALVLTQPWGPRVDSSSDDTYSYDQLLEHRDAAWPAMLADGFAFALLAVCVAIATCHLVCGRGRVAATVGSAVLVVGGILFAMGATGGATLAWFTTSDGLSEEAGRDLVGYLNDNPGHVLGPQMVGFLLFTVGSLVLAGALIRSRAVPRLAPVVFVVLTIALFAGLPGPVMNAVQAAQAVLLGALALPLVRSVALGR